MQYVIYARVYRRASCVQEPERIVIAGLTVVALVIGCIKSHDFYLNNYYIMYVTINVLYIALYVVLPVTVLGKSFMSTTALLLMF